MRSTRVTPDMPSRIRRTKAPATLSFSDWLEREHPEKTPMRTVLRMIGVLDIAYLFHRFGPGKAAPEPRRENPILRRAVEKTAGPIAPLRPARRARAAKPEARITHKERPVAPPETKRAEPVKEIEPEPIVIEEAPMPEDTGPVRLDDRTSDVDILKSRRPLLIAGSTVTFEKREIDGEEETLLSIDDRIWRLTLTSPSMNLSAMTQVVRTVSGELHLLGRMALGALSGEAYVSAEEARRITEMLKTATGTCDIDVTYASKDASTRNRTYASTRIRFVKIDK